MRGLVYHRRMGKLTGFVLAGGQSTRMGADKAFLEWEGRTLLGRALQSLSNVTPDVYIVGSKQKFSGYGLVVEDEFPNHGPLGGIHAALRARAGELNLILAVDMPFVGVEFLEYLVQEAGKSAATVTVPRAGGGWQPLCAVYRPGFGDLAEQALRQDKNKIAWLFDGMELRVLEEAELVIHGFSVSIFQNLNTPEELHQSKLQMAPRRLPSEI